MKLIVISSPQNFKGEIEIVCSLFENGLEFFHVHKPTSLPWEIQNYLQLFPEKYRNKIFLHSDFPKFHSLEELQYISPLFSNKKKMFFLSPIFNSISKKGYKSMFTLQELKLFLQLLKTNPTLQQKLGWACALGGIDESKIEACHKLGFAGVAVCGAIWNDENPQKKFLSIKNKCMGKDLVY
jgi:thiamine-phosphate pyrophosphorylase